MPPGRAERDGLRERGRCLRSDVDHDISERARGCTQRSNRVLVRDVDGEVGTERPRRVQAGRVVGAAPGHEHEAGARLADRGNGRQPADPGPEHRNHVARARARQRDTPADACADRVEQRRQDGVERCRHRHEHRVGREVLELGVATPQARRPVDGHEAVHVAQAVPRAAPVLARAACRALAARLEDLHRDAVSGGDPPALRGAGSDLLEHADHLVTRHEGEAAEQHARVLLVVGATEPARLDAQHGVVLADGGTSQLANHEAAGSLEHRRPSHRTRRWSGGVAGRQERAAAARVSRAAASDTSRGRRSGIDPTSGVARAQRVLEDLPRRVARQRVDELELLGHLLLRQPLAGEELEELLEGGRIGLVRGHDDRARALTGPRVGQADHRDVSDLRVREEEVFELLGGDVLAVPDDDVLDVAR